MKNLTETCSSKSDNWVVTNIPMNYFSIWNKYTNNWIKYHRIIAKFLWLFIDKSFRNWLWWITKLSSRVLKNKCLFMNQSMYRRWVWMEISPSCCISVMNNTFWPTYCSKISWWTKCSINNFNIFPNKMPWTE